MKDSEQAGKVLIGYVVAEAGVSGRQVRESVRQELPDHMVPQVVVLIGEMPLTANGKLDRKMLKSMAEVEPEQVEAVKERAATAVEEIIAGIWQEVLKRESVGLTQNFFDLGGHSLLATQVIVRVRRAFNVEIGLKKLFEKATVEGLARVVEQMKRSGAGPSTSAIRRVPRLGIAAAAAQQECGKECLLSALHDSSQHNQLADPIVVKRG
jgi:acyl carrier protein